jgi:competence protein ComEC
VAAVGVWVIEAAPPAPDGRLTVWVLDVGQGSSAVARLPGGQVMLIDGGGGLGDLDLGQRVIAPFLWSQGLTRVDVVAASHRHPDHVGGLPFIARWFGPRQVWTNGVALRETSSLDTYSQESPAPDASAQEASSLDESSAAGPLARLVATARERGISLLGPAELAGEREMSGARIKVIWPPAGEAARLSENDRSLWIGLGLGETWVWLPGDAGPKVEKAVLSELGDGRGPSRPGEHFLLAPHHGGKGSTSAQLLERLRPQGVAISCGCVNSFGMPRTDTLERIEAAGARTWLTATQGCLKLTSDGRSWRVEPYLEPPRDCPLPRR